MFLNRTQSSLPAIPADITVLKADLTAALLRALAAEGHYADFATLDSRSTQGGIIAAVCAWAIMDENDGVLDELRALSKIFAHAAVTLADQYSGVCAYLPASTGARS